MVSVHSITRTKSFLNNLLRSLSLNVFTSVVIHAEFICSEQTPFLCQNPHQSATHHVCIFSPGIFDSLEVHQAAPVPKNLISSADAKKRLCSIRGSTLFRTIAVVQWARNLGRTLKLCDCYRSENPLGEKYNSVASQHLTLIWQIWVWTCHNSTAIHGNSKIKRPSLKSNFHILFIRSIYVIVFCYKTSSVQQISFKIGILSLEN